MSTPKSPRFVPLLWMCPREECCPIPLSISFPFRMATGEREHDTLVLDASGDTEGHAIYSKLNVISLPQIVIVIYTQLLLTENAISTLDDFSLQRDNLDLLGRTVFKP